MYSLRPFRFSHWYYRGHFIWKGNWEPPQIQFFVFWETWSQKSQVLFKNHLNGRSAHIFCGNEQIGISKMLLTSYTPPKEMAPKDLRYLKKLCAAKPMKVVADVRLWSLVRFSSQMWHFHLRYTFWKLTKLATKKNGNISEGWLITPLERKVFFFFW